MMGIKVELKTIVRFNPMPLYRSSPSFDDMESMYSVVLQTSISPSQQHSTYGYHECLLTSREGVIVCMGRIVCEWEWWIGGSGCSRNRHMR